MLKPEYNKLYDTKWWITTRKRVLGQSPRCVMCLASNKQTPAREVDHIIPHKGDRDLFYDHDNLQSLCKSCHSKKTWYENKNIRVSSKYLPKDLKPKSKDITLVIGAPCSGKTTWAKKQGKKVIDFDDIKQSVSGQNPYDMNPAYLNQCFMVRNEIIANTEQPMIVIGTLADPDTRHRWITQLNAKVVLMITQLHECKARLMKTDRPNKRGQSALIDRWFSEFRPLGNENFAS